MNGPCIGREDIISNLPRDIIESILEQMPTRDAARTSILSTKWRCTGTTISQLVLNKQFFEDTLKIKPTVIPELVRIVSIVDKILLLHNGPIMKFVLYIPRVKRDCIPRIQSDCSSDFDRWLLFISRNGIKDLTLDNSRNNPYKLHSCIYSCPGLTHLKLANFILKPPHELSGFRDLISLRRYTIRLAHNMLRTLLPMSPLLQLLSIAYCSGINDFIIHAPNLKTLILHYSDEITLLCFMVPHNLHCLCNETGKEIMSHRWEKTPNVVEFLGNLPRIVNLSLDGFFPKVLATGNVPRRLPNTINLLKTLTLLNIGLHEWDHVSCTLCLIRSCPNLTELEIQLSSQACTIKRTVEVRVLNYLEAPDCMNQMLDKLLSVRIRSIEGLKPELFIKLLLANSPMLETMLVEHTAQVDVSEGFRIEKELAQFPPLSSKVKIIHSKAMALK